MDIKILVVESNRHISGSICPKLCENGFQTKVVSYYEYYGDKEKYAFFDLKIYVIDKQENTDNIPGFVRPVLFILERADFPRKMKSFYMGMEDYIAEPVNTTELILRINMLLRCFGVNVKQNLNLGGLSLDVTSREVTVNGKSVSLTAGEFNIMLCVKPSAPL